jgi:hypothetical protein
MAARYRIILKTMTPNPVIERRYIFFRSARVILNDTLFLKLLRNKEYHFIVALSQNKISVPDQVIIKHKKTFTISLRRMPKEILQSFHDTTRNEVRRSFNMPELTITKNDEQFEKAYTLYMLFRKEKKLPVKSASFLRQAMRFSAYWNGELLAVVTCYDVPPYMRIQHIYSRNAETKEDRNRAGLATRRLIYEVCQYGSMAGRELLDMASINMHNQKKQGITKFKLSFGGTITNEYIYTYRSPLIRFLGRFL